MRNENMFVLFLFVFALFFLAGCSELFRGTDEGFGVDYGQGLSRKGLSFDSYQQCEEGTCMCEVCDYKDESFLCKIKPIWGHDATPTPDNPTGEARCPLVSLQEATCTFKPCDREKFFELLSNFKSPLSNEGPHQFMVGVGPTFSDFTAANPYCDNRLDMAVKWLVGDERNRYEYPLPESDRAACFLDLGITPVYVLYSNGHAIDNVDRAGQIARELAGQGPVIITTEIDFDSADFDTVNAIKDQIRAMRTECPKQDGCMLAIAPKMGDKNALQAIFGSAAIPDEEMKDDIDLVAYGINSKEYDKPFCDAPHIFRSAVEYSRYATYTYGKPTLIAYMAFEPDVETKGHCTWSGENLINNPENPQNPYGYFFDQIGLLRSSGVIGASVYSFSSISSNPLNCKGCTVKTPEIEPDKDGRLRSWSALCQNYKSKNDPSTPSVGQWVAYKSKPGASCSFANNAEDKMRLQYAGGDLTQRETPPFRAALDYTISCEACAIGPSDNPGADGKYQEEDVRKFPFAIGEAGLRTPPAEFCSKYSDIIGQFLEDGAHGSEADFDSMLVRAIIWHESNFDTCATAVKSIGNEFCNYINKDGRVIEITNNPADDVLPKLHTKITADLDYYTETCNGGNQPLLGGRDTPPETGKKYCAYGLMQIIDYPEYIYTDPAINIEPTDYVEECKILDAGGNPEEFNPYDPRHNICAGVKHLQDNVLQAKSYVERHTDELGTDDDNKKRVMSIYLALHYYGGDIAELGFRLWGRSDPDYVLDQFLTDFNAQKECHDDSNYFCEADGEGGFKPKCSNNQDFINFVNFCEMSGRYSSYEQRDLAYEILLNYRSMTEKCSTSLCPLPKRILEQAFPREG